MPLSLQSNIAIAPAQQTSKIEFYWYFAFFLVSGFCALVYEVVWLRLAMATFGVTAALASIVLSMFMAGLGLGSWGAGVLARRYLNSEGPRALRFYSLAELLIGTSSLAVPFELKLGRELLLHLGAPGAWQTSGYYVLVGLWMAATLLPWCTCMGSTFPFLMAVIRQSPRAEAQRSFSYLYVANVLGALLGTLLSAFVLIELFGLAGTLCVAGGLNALLASVALWMSFRRFSGSMTQDITPTRKTGPNLYGFRSGVVLILLFTTGLVSMGMEVVWIRQLTPYLGNVVYAFAEILGTYLLATFIGSRDYRWWAQSHQPDESASTWSLLAFCALIPLLGADPMLTLMATGFRLASIVMFCALAGFLTPLLVDTWSSGDPERAGTAYAANVLGCILGPLVAGFLLLPRVGERWAILLLSIPLFGIAALTTFRGAPETSCEQRHSRPRLKFAVAAIAGGLIFFVSHDYERQFRDSVVRRDYTATVIAKGKGFARRLLVNGTGMTALTPDTKYMTHLPLVFMSRPPQNGLVICFGMGTSFRSMVSWGIKTTAVDLVPSVPALFGYFHADAQQVLGSPRARVVVDDGRRFLDGSTESFDVIVVDPPPPVEAPESSLLYSREFYEVIKRHLRPGGILQAWYPPSGDQVTTASITKTLLKSFPYVRAFESYNNVGAHGIHFLASMEPIPMTSTSILASRIPPTAVADLLEWGPEKTPEKQLDRVLSQEIVPEDLIAADPGVPELGDNQPINEYYMLRRLFHKEQ